MRIKDRSIFYLIYAKQFTIVSFRSEIQISIYYIFLLNRDFFFKFNNNQLLFYVYFVNIFIIFVIVKNKFDQIVKIS